MSFNTLIEKHPLGRNNSAVKKFKISLCIKHKVNMYKADKVFDKYKCKVFNRISYIKHK